MKRQLFLMSTILIYALSLLAQKSPRTTGFQAQLNKATQQIKSALEAIFKYDSVPGDPFRTRVYTFPNGLKVYLSPYHVQPKVFTMIAIKAGSKYDPYDATGLAHYLEHMLFKGTDKFGTKNYEAEKPLLDKIEELFETYRKITDEKERKKIYHQIDSISFIAAKYAIANEYDKMTAAIGAQGTNAFTTNDETIYINEIPSNQINTWLDIEAERFRNPVFRLFHTELEAVYEEKNRTLDNDEIQAYESLYRELFPNHPYGTQTTIGTIEHLKNPSLKEIKKYYEKYYVPNNMAIIMCGDFNPDSVIRQIFARFGSMPSKPITPVQLTSPNLNQRVAKTIYGPKSEKLFMAWKADGAASKDNLYLTFISSILYNGKSGLIDLNVNAKQKVLNSYVFSEGLKDYSYLLLYAEPKEGQSLEEVEKILLDEIHKLQKGEFDEQLLNDIITNKKLELQSILENNTSRAFTLFTAFTRDIPLYQIVHQINELKKIKKEDIIHFAKEYLKDNNYVVIYKKTGTNQNIKVTKPEITPVELDRQNISAFTKDIISRKPKAIAPKFLDFKKDIQSYSLIIPTATRSLELLYNKNTENELFELIYYYQLSSEDLKKYNIAFEYLNRFPASETKKVEEIQKTLYKLGCNLYFYLSIPDATAYIFLSGLSENADKAIAILEEILKTPQIDENTYKEFIIDYTKEREDLKKDKNFILQQLTAYATYGPKNMRNDVLTNQQLKELSKDNLIQLIKDLNAYPHQIFYYGPQSANDVIKTLKQQHHLPPKTLSSGNVKIYPTEILSKGKNIFYTPYTMQQAELSIVSKATDFDSKLIPSIKLFNEYFGGNMSGVVFQEIRESKALAYTAIAYVTSPYNAKYPFITRAYIGTQADKLKDALDAIHFLLDSIPYNQTSFDAAKEGIIQQIRTERFIKSNVFFEYINAKKLGLNYDIRKDIFEKVQKMKFNDIWNFHKNYIRKKPRNIAIIGDEEKLDMNVLKQYGEIKKVSLEEIFGY